MTVLRQCSQRAIRIGQQCITQCSPRYLTQTAKQSSHQSSNQWARYTGLAAGLSFLAYSLSNLTTISAESNNQSDVFTDERPNRGVRQFTSSPLFAHPNYKGITIATAESLDQLINQRSSRNEHVLLEIYSPYCHACERLSPIVHQVGEVTHKLSQASTSSSNKPSLRVAVMDDSRNHKPGFLTRQEERYLPLIKLFPANTTESYVYEGPHNAMAILRFVNSHLPESERLDMKAVEPFVVETNDKTQAELVDVYERQRKDEIAHDPTIQLFDAAPCGTELSKLMQEMILGRYRSIVTKEDQTRSREERDRLLKEFNTCVAKNGEQTVKFWKKIADLANGQLESAQKSLAAQNEAEGKDATTESSE